MPVRAPLFAHHLFHRCSAMRAVRWLNRHGATILMYHDFPEDRSLFEAQCEYLRRHYRVLSMTEFARALRNRSLPPHSAVISVDDGHRDFYQHAFPVLRRFGFPATLYVATESVSERKWLWFDRVVYAFYESPLTTVELPTPEIENGQHRTVLVTLGNRAQRFEIADRFRVWATILPNRAMRRYLRLLEEALQVNVPEAPTPEFAVLTWDEMREMMRHGIEIGAHTVTYPILSQIEDAAELHSEIRNSKLAIENALDAPARHFAYPSGRPQDYSAPIAEAVRDAGFETSVITTRGQVFAGDDPLFLKRIAFSPDMPWYRFRQHVAGFRA